MAKYIKREDTRPGKITVKVEIGRFTKSTFSLPVTRAWKAFEELKLVAEMFYNPKGE